MHQPDVHVQTVCLQATPLSFQDLPAVTPGLIIRLHNTLCDCNYHPLSVSGSPTVNPAQNMCRQPRSQLRRNYASVGSVFAIGLASDPSRQTYFRYSSNQRFRLEEDLSSLFRTFAGFGCTAKEFVANANNILSAVA
jgi:hypothetical protein